MVANNKLRYFTVVMFTIASVITGCSNNQPAGVFGKGAPIGIQPVWCQTLKNARSIASAEWETDHSSAGQTTALKGMLTAITPYISDPRILRITEDIQAVYATQNGSVPLYVAAVETLKTDGANALSACP